MGIPKFYRWISERYPCLSQTVREHEVPEFDNLYLDMNGIIHQCSHGNSEDPNFRITEEKIFKDVCAYIDMLFRTIKPKKVFYMAVDGCAPRAKMNQQRARRFRSARDAEEARQRAIEEGTMTAADLEDPPFDSNCITPGTPFMCRLQQQLEYFVHAKLASDPAWSAVNVILSGNEVPGEGEHKIMDYIRSLKASPTYDPNTRHCMYGLDADLVMLGLASHEPHFSLLREEVKFTKSPKKTGSDTQVFHLLSLSLYREYLNMEFSDLKQTLPFEYDFERLLDDWIMLGFMVGNDFLPHLPYFHINEDILPRIYQYYRAVLPEMDGWLTDGGYINMQNLQLLMNALSEIDNERLEEDVANFKWMQSKRSHGNDNDGDILAGLAAHGIDVEGADDDDDDEEEIREAQLTMLKANYYREKMHVEQYDEKFRRQQAQEYVTGLQWVLLYYYRGVQSWSWFFPSHYAPFVSDIVGIADFVPQFEMGQPFHPFEQLLSVLPPASKAHVPPGLQPLMTDPDSPILDFYPLEFELDLNGKKNDWEALVLIPFIDQERLLRAIKSRAQHLTADEIARNQSRTALSYKHDRHANGVAAESPYPDQFPRVVAQVRVEVLSFPHADADAPPLRYLDNFDRSRYYPGFPTFRFQSYAYGHRHAHVKVFNFPTKNESMIVDVRQNQYPTAAEVALSRRLLGTAIFVRWPHLHEAQLVSVRTADAIFELDEHGQPRKTKAPPAAQRVFHDTSERLCHDLLIQRGIDVGSVSVLLEVRLNQGYSDHFTADGMVERRPIWAKRTMQFPLQVCLLDLQVYRDDHNLKQVPLSERVTPGAEFCYVGQPFYGSFGHVVNLDTNETRVAVDLQIRPEADVEPVFKTQGKTPYVPLSQAARATGIHAGLLNRLLGDVYLWEGTREQPDEKHNIGLRLKFSKKGLQVIGMTMRTADNNWHVSQACIQVILGYKHRFPGVIEALQQASYSGDLFGQELLGPSARDTLRALSKYLQSDVGVKRWELVPCGTEATATSTLHQLEKVLDLQLARVQRAPSVQRLDHVRPQFLLLQHTVLRDGLGQLADPHASFQLGDRVACVRAAGSVPWAAHGYLVGLYGGDSDDVEVLFDEPFMGGTNLGGRIKSLRGYRLPLAFLVNLSYGRRAAGLPSYVPGEARVHTPSSTSSAAAAPAVASNPDASQRLLGMLRKTADTAPTTPTTNADSYEPPAGATLPPVLPPGPTLPAPGDATVVRQGQLKGQALLSALKAKTQGAQGATRAVPAQADEPVLLLPAPAGSEPAEAGTDAVPKGRSKLPVKRTPHGPGHRELGFRGRQARQEQQQRASHARQLGPDALLHQRDVQIDGQKYDLDDYAQLWQTLIAKSRQ